MYNNYVDETTIMNNNEHSANQVGDKSGHVHEGFLIECCVTLC